MSEHFLWASPEDAFTKSEFVAWARLWAPQLRNPGNVYDHLFEELRKRGGPTFCNSEGDCAGSACDSEHRISRNRFVFMSKREEQEILQKLTPAKAKLIANYRDLLKSTMRKSR